MGKVIGIDLGTTNSCVAVMEGSHAQSHRERRRRAHHAVHRRLHGRRRAPRRPAGQAPGRHQSGAHLLRHQAPDRPHLRRSDDQEGHGSRPLQDRQGPERRRLGRGRRQAVFALADLRLHPAEDEGDGRGLSRPAGHPGGHHRSGLLQRRPAPGDQGRRQDRRPRGPAHHQRADGGGARLRPRQEAARHHRGLRPRRRHLRRLDPRDRRRRLRGEVDQRRHLPRRRGLRHAPRRVSRGRVQEGAGHRPDEGQARPAAPEGSGREGQDRAVLGAADRDQPALHHGRRLRSEAPRPQALARQVREPWSTISSRRPSSPAARRSRMPASRPARSTRSFSSAA